MSLHRQIAILLLFFSIFINPAQSKEDTYLLELKLSCGKPKSAQGNAWTSTLYGISTPYTFQASRYWNSRKYKQVGQHVLEGYWTEKLFFVKGKGKWQKRTNTWSMQFKSKGNMSIIEHLKEGIKGFEGEGKWRRECELKMTQSETAGRGLSVGYKEKSISRLVKERKNLQKAWEMEEKDLQKRLTIGESKISALNEEISTLTNQNINFKAKEKSLNEQVAELSTSLQEARKSAEKTELSASLSDDKLKEMQAKIATRDAEIRLLKDEQQNLLANAKADKAEFDSQQKNLKKYQINIQNLREKLADARSQISAHQDAENELKFKLEQLEIKYSETQIPESEKLKKAEENILTLTGQLTDVQRRNQLEYDRLKSENSVLENKIEKAVSSLDKCNLDLQQKSKSLATLEGSHMDISKRFDEANSELIKLKSKLPKSQGGTAICIEW